jgi:thiol:disulfide interchange protein DsbC
VSIIHKYVTRLLLAALLAVPSLTFADPAGWPKGILSGIDAMKKLPVQGFSVVESQGRVMLVSSNGHYAVVDGRIMDMWNGFEIRSVADVERSLAIPLEKMGIGPKELSGIVIGAPAPGRPKPVTVFLDPASPETRKILPAIQQFANDYPFHVVFIPARRERNKASQALLCSPEAAEQFITSGRVTSAEPTDMCGADKLKRNIVTVQVLGIDTLPFTIASNGQVSPGVPKNFGEFLSKNLEYAK